MFINTISLDSTRTSGKQRVWYASREQKSTRPDEEREQRCDNNQIHWSKDVVAVRVDSTHIAH